MQIRAFTEADAARALELNNEAVPAVNAHDAGSFAALVAMADRVWVADEDGVLGAMLVTFAPGAAYDSKNYLLLSERFDDFRYVDRIIVAPSHKRQGLGAKLYETLYEQAAVEAAQRLLCEVNVDPPNPQSIAFHENSGWTALEDKQHAPGAVVRYFEKPVR